MIHARRFLAGLLALCLLCTALPVCALGAQAEPEEDGSASALPTEGEETPAVETTWVETVTEAPMDTETPPVCSWIRR